MHYYQYDFSKAPHHLLSADLVVLIIYISVLFAQITAEYEIFFFQHNGTCLTGLRSNKPGEFFECLRSLYADDEAFMLASREDMIMATSPLHTDLQRFGCLCMWDHVQLNLVKAASPRPRLKQYSPPRGDTLLMRSNQILLITTYYVMVVAS